MPDLKLRLNKDMLVVAPLLTPGLLDLALEDEESLEYLNILDEELIRQTYQRFKLAGAGCALTNTLGANRLALQSVGLQDALVDINRAAVRLVREAGFEHSFAVVALAEEGILLEQIETLLLENPDAIMLVNNTNEYDLAPAIAGIQELTDLPVIAPILSVQEGHEGSVAKLIEELAIGVEAAKDANILYFQGLDWYDSLKVLRQLAALSSLPLMVCPRPEVPSDPGERHYRMAVSQAADEMIGFALEARTLGAGLIGTTPGSSPVITGALYAAVGGLDTSGK